jgi:sugar lactone lactonase YvrE
MKHKGIQDILLDLLKLKIISIMRRSVLLIIILSLVAVSCRTGNKKVEENTSAQLKQFIITELWRTDTILLTPESVIFDKSRDVIYVSNMNLEPRLKDGNGFISRLDNNGKILDLHWIDGLSSPKGLAILRDTLFAADVDEIVAMDINSGRIIKKIPVPGGKMINDITSAPDGTLYITDTDANKIYHYSGGKVIDWLAEGLSGPNGLLLDGERMLIASQGSNDYASADLNTKDKIILTENINHADGIAFTGIPGYYFVSDWNGIIYMVNPDYSKVTLLNTTDTQSNTADLAYDPEINLLIVPTFYKNCVVAYRLEEQGQ